MDESGISNAQLGEGGRLNVEAVPGLKACPFCGSDAVALVGSFVRCGNCGATGPFGATAAEAVEKWNERSHLVVDGGRRSAAL